MTPMAPDPQPPSGDCDPLVDELPRCWRCGKLLGERLTRPWVVRCPRCKARIAQPIDPSGPS